MMSIDDKLRCPRCGVMDGEGIEEDVPTVGLSCGVDIADGKVTYYCHGDPDEVKMVREVTREAYFETAENQHGETVYICSECGHYFTFKEYLVSQGGN